MDARIEKAFELESTGNFRKALDEYLIINTKTLSAEDNIFLERSISACLFYLKEYEEAEKHFAEILKKYNLDSITKNKIQDSINLCYLYGGKIKKAEEYFLKKLKIKNLSDGEKCWVYWYLGQCCFLKNEYAHMEDFYSQNIILSTKTKHERTSFFMAHLMVSEILNGKYKEFEQNLNITKDMEDKSFGQLKIVESIYNKIKGINNWECLYNKGINEAQESKYVENVELGEFLKNML